MNNLTKIAALPMGSGCLSSLPPEVGEQPKVQMKAEYFQHPDDSTGVYAFEAGGLVRIGDVTPNRAHSHADRFQNEERN